MVDDADLIPYVPGGTVVRRVLYRESEVNPKPQFPGGEKAYKAYLQQNVKYPAEAMKRKLQGAVRVGFTVKADGTISNVKLERKVHTLLDKEALRVVKAMPKWRPGYFEGKPVPVKMSLPVQFRSAAQRPRQKLSLQITKLKNPRQSSFPSVLLLRLMMVTC